MYQTFNNIKVWKLKVQPKNIVQILKIYIIVSKTGQKFLNIYLNHNSFQVLTTCWLSLFLFLKTCNFNVNLDCIVNFACLVKSLFYFRFVLIWN